MKRDLLLFRRLLYGFGCLEALCLSASQTLPNEPFKLLTTAVKIPERGKVTAMIVQTQSNRFSFLPPPNWRVGCNSKEGQVTMMPRDLGASLRIRIVSAVNDAAEMDPDQLRQQILTRFPGAADLNEFACYTSGGSGVGFDFKRLMAHRSKIATRFAFVPFPGGRIEFSLTAPSTAFTNYHFAFGNLLTSFHLEESVPDKAAVP